MANLQIVISALNKASGDLNKVKQDISGVKDAGEKGGTAVQGFGDSLSGMMGKAALVAGVVAGVGVAMKEVYETAKEGGKPGETAKWNREHEDVWEIVDQVQKLREAYG